MAKFIGLTNLAYLWGKLKDLLNTKVDNTISINGHLLNGNILITKRDIGLNNVTNDTLIPIILKGAPNGVCPLNANLKINTQYLPDSIYDIINVYARSDLTPLGFTWFTSTTGETITPEQGRIYVLLNDFPSDSEHPLYAANSLFRWGGTEYVQLTDCNLNWDNLNDNFIDKEDFSKSSKVISAALCDLEDRKLDSIDLPEIIAITNVEIQNLN